MARSHYTFRKRQKELARKKKKERKMQRRMENKFIETDETESEALLEARRQGPPIPAVGTDL